MEAYLIAAIAVAGSALTFLFTVWKSGRTNGDVEMVRADVAELQQRVRELEKDLEHCHSERDRLQKQSDRLVDENNSHRETIQDLRIRLAGT